MGYGNPTRPDMRYLPLRGTAILGAPFVLASSTRGCVRLPQYTGSDQHFSVDDAALVVVRPGARHRCGTAPGRCAPRGQRAAGAGQVPRSAGGLLCVGA